MSNLKVVSDESSASIVAPSASSMRINLDRPDVADTKELARHATKVSDATSIRAGNLVALAHSKFDAFADDPEGFGLLVGTSLSAAKFDTVPSTLRSHLITMVLLESSMTKGVKNQTGSSATSYLQMISSTRAAFIKEGEKFKNQLLQMLPSSSTEFLTSALTAMGMWSLYDKLMDNNWRWTDSSGWVYRGTHSSSPVVRLLTSKYGDFLKQKDVGRQMLLTALHFYTGAFSMREGYKLSPELDSRFVIDALLFRAVLKDSKAFDADYLAKVKAQGGSGNRKLLMVGDPALPTITSKYSSTNRKATKETKARPHKGIDIRATEGTPLAAVVTGHIESILRQKSRSGYGLYVTLEGKNGARYRYAHLSKNVNGLRSGDKVKEGDTIGFTGKSGTINPHLHFEYFPAGKDKQADPQLDPDQAWTRVFITS